MATRFLARRGGRFLTMRNDVGACLVHFATADQAAEFFAQLGVDTASAPAVEFVPEPDTSTRLARTLRIDGHVVSPRVHGDAGHALGAVETLRRAFSWRGRKGASTPL